MHEPTLFDGQLCWCKLETIAALLVWVAVLTNVRNWSGCYTIDSLLPLGCLEVWTYYIQHLEITKGCLFRRTHLSVNTNYLSSPASSPSMSLQKGHYLLFGCLWPSDWSLAHYGAFRPLWKCVRLVQCCILSVLFQHNNLNILCQIRWSGEDDDQLSRQMSVSYL